MKAVILAAGKGTRFGPLTARTPKPLICVKGKTLIRHVLDALPEQISECVIVVGHLGEQIKNALGAFYRGFSLRYVEQEKTGTGGALLAAKPYLESEEKFLVVGSDDLFGARELAKLTAGRYFTIGISAEPIEVLGAIGITLDPLGFFHGYHRAYHGERRYRGVGAYVLPRDYFWYNHVQLPNGELSLPHSLEQMPFSLKAVTVEEWLPVNDPVQKERAEQWLAHHPA